MTLNISNARIFITSIIRLDIKYGFAVNTVFDKITPLDGKEEAEFYCIETKNCFPFRGNGFYIEDLIYCALYKQPLN